MPVSRKVENVEALVDNDAINYKYNRGNLEFDIDVPSDCIDYVIKVTLK